MSNTERSLTLKQLLEEIDNGSVTSTSQLDFDTKGLVHDNPNLISGQSNRGSPNGTVKYNLKLTKQGLSTLRFLSLALKDIDNSFGKDSLNVWLVRPVVVALITLVFSVPITAWLTYQINKNWLQESVPKTENQECN